MYYLVPHATDGFYTSYKQTVHPSDLKNIRFLVSTCLLIRLFQTSKVQTKAETMESNMSWQESGSKHLHVF